MEKQIIVYEPRADIRLEVKTDGETVWLTQEQMCRLFRRERSVITKHVRNIFREGELVENSASANLGNCILNLHKYKPLSFHLVLYRKTFRFTSQVHSSPNLRMPAMPVPDFAEQPNFAQAGSVGDGANRGLVQNLHKTPGAGGRPLTCYNLGVIISVGYRAKPLQGTRFRQECAEEALLRREGRAHRRRRSRPQGPAATAMLREMLMRRCDELRRIGKSENRMDAEEGEVRQIIAEDDFMSVRVGRVAPRPPHSERSKSCAGMRMHIHRRSRREAVARVALATACEPNTCQSVSDTRWSFNPERSPCFQERAISYRHPADNDADQHNKGGTSHLVQQLAEPPAPPKRRRIGFCAEEDVGRANSAHATLHGKRGA